MRHVGNHRAAQMRAFLVERDVVLGPGYVLRASRAQNGALASRRLTRRRPAPAPRAGGGSVHLALRTPTHRAARTPPGQPPGRRRSGSVPSRASVEFLGSIERGIWSAGAADRSATPPVSGRERVRRIHDHGARTKRARSRRSISNGVMNLMRRPRQASGILILRVDAEGRSCVTTICPAACAWATT
jgi:hypothetical protein